MAELASNCFHIMGTNCFFYHYCVRISLCDTKPEQFSVRIYLIIIFRNYLILIGSTIRIQFIFPDNLFISVLIPIFKCKSLCRCKIMYMTVLRTVISYEIKPFTDIIFKRFRTILIFVTAILVFKSSVIVQYINTFQRRTASEIRKTDISKSRVIRRNHFRQ